MKRKRPKGPASKCGPVSPPALVPALKEAKEAGIIIGLIAFVLSFDALRLVFVSCGINPWLSWGGPVCVDGTILLCTWATWGFKKGHIRGSAYPWVGLVLFSGFSIAGNALHAMINTGFRLPSWVPRALFPSVVMADTTASITGWGFWRVVAALSR